MLYFSPSNGNLNGYFRYLVDRKIEYDNIELYPSSTYDSNFLPENIYKMDNLPARWAAKNNPVQYFQFFFKNAFVQITHYSLRSPNQPSANAYMRSWNFSGSCDNGTTWVLLDTVPTSDQMKNNYVYNQEVNPQKFLFNTFRITQLIGTPYDNIMRISAIEVFGNVILKGKNCSCKKISILRVNIFFYLIFIY